MSLRLKWGADLRETAIDGQLDPRGEGRVESEKQHRSRDFLGRAMALHGGYLVSLFLEGCSLFFGESGNARKEAGASEDKARRAAEAIASYDARFHKIESDIATLRAETRGEFNFVRWMIGFNLAMTITILWKVFS